MWCERCHKSVTGTRSGEDESVVCAHCGTILPPGLQANDSQTSCQDEFPSASPLPCPGLASNDAIKSWPTPASDPDAVDANASTATSVAATSARQPLLALESWEIDEDLRHMQRLLRGRRFVDNTGNGDQLRCDAGPNQPGTQGTPAISWLTAVRSGVARIMTLGGTTSLACGLALLGWWHFGTRADLCAPGLICTIAGQFLLLVGIVLSPGKAASIAPVVIGGLSSHPLLDDELHKELSDARLD